MTKIGKIFIALNFTSILCRQLNLQQISHSFEISVFSLQVHIQAIVNYIALYIVENESHKIHSFHFIYHNIEVNKNY